MSESQQAKCRVSYNQLLNLYEFLNNHREIAVGYNKSLTARDYSKKMWGRLAEILNSAGDGAIKSGSEWSKYWVDLKAKIKRKNRLINDARRGTGGGPALDLVLSEIDRKFLSILGQDFGSGLPGVQVNPLPSQEYEESIEFEHQSNPGTSQSTGSTEPIYLEVESIENENQQNELNLNLAQSSSASSSTSANSQPTTEPRILSDQVETPPSIRSRQSTEQGSQGVPLSSPPPPTLPRQGTVQGPRRRQRRNHQNFTAAMARERLILASEARARAESANSRSMERVVDLIGEMVTIMRRIEAKLPAGAPTGERQDPAYLQFPVLSTSWIYIESHSRLHNSFMM